MIRFQLSGMNRVFFIKESTRSTQSFSRLDAAVDVGLAQRLQLKYKRAITLRRLNVKNRPFLLVLLLHHHAVYVMQ